MPRGTRAFIPLVAVLVPPIATAQEPLASPVTERVERRLVQLDITVEGSAEALTELTPSDFEIVVGGRRVDDFELDSLCNCTSLSNGAHGQPSSTERQTHSALPAPGSSSRSFLFYFDQPHLTMEGRLRALELSRTLIPSLVRGNARAEIVSNGNALETLASLTTDHDVLLAALDAVEADRTHWDPYPSYENQRVQDVYDALDVDLRHAQRRAQSYQIEEAFRSTRAMRRFEAVLAGLTSVAPPTVVFYFADTLRSRPGAHYASLVHPIGDDRPSRVHTMLASADLSRHSLDRLIRTAAANGVRLYTIQAAGLVQSNQTPSPSPLQLRYGLSNPVPWRQRVLEAQEALSILALETGGKAFLNGVSAKRIAAEVADDLGCMYLASFDPAILPEDQNLPVLVRVKAPGVTAQTRGQLVVPSASSRLTSRLLGAFTRSNEQTEDSRVTAALLPVAFANGKYTTLLQVSTHASETHTSRSWDIGASIIWKDHISEVSKRIGLSQASAMTFEAEVILEPGPYEIVVVAHETHADTIVSRTLEGTLPDPHDASAVISTIAALQPNDGIFVRGDRITPGGTRIDPFAIDSAQPLSFATLLCRRKGASDDGEWRVRRELVGMGQTAVMPDSSVRFGDDTCVWHVDEVPHGTIADGDLRYSISLWRGNHKVGSATKELSVAGNLAVPPMTISSAH